MSTNKSTHGLSKIAARRKAKRYETLGLTEAIMSEALEASTSAPATRAGGTVDPDTGMVLFALDPPRTYSSGTGAVDRKIMAGHWNASTANPGVRTDWEKRPTWHGLVYGNGRKGTGTESITGPNATFAWPVLCDANGVIRPAPEGSRFHTAMPELFLKHAEKHGWEMVAEAAAGMGVRLSKSTPAKAASSTAQTSLKRRRRTTAYLISEIREMSKRGLAVGAIGDALNIADRRVKEILAAVT